MNSPRNGGNGSPFTFRFFRWIVVLALSAVSGLAGIQPDPGHSQPEPAILRLNGSKTGRTFEGIGACSAGASSRLLIEYPEPYRSRILDYLFKPNFGAGFQHLKVEVGGDVNSTDGCEPSHMHTRNDLNCRRGYEWWLMTEARKRNPRIFLEGLEWGAPAWIGQGNFYSPDNAEYLAQFLLGARKEHGLDLDFIGIWNETRYDTGWIKLLRQTLDRHQLHQVNIIAAEEINQWSVVDLLKTDAELAKAIHAVGTHYPKYQSSTAAKTCNRPIWSSEDGPWKGNWEGARILAKMYNRNYIEGRMTKTVIWSPITSYYDNLPLPGSGVLRANTPWSGHYEVQPALWVAAHTTQFAQPGWIYLEDGGCGYLPLGGSYVTLKSPSTEDYSLIIETVDARTPQTVTFQLDGGLSTAPVRVWCSTGSISFVRLSDLTPANGALTVTLHGGSLYSLTTTSGQNHGEAINARPQRFPRSYREDFEKYPPGATPLYFSDQAGLFEVVKRKGSSGQSLRQVVDQKGLEWPFHLNPSPETILGDANWRDYAVSVDALIEKEGYVSLFGRVGIIPQTAGLPEGYWLKVAHTGYWELGTARLPLISGKVGFEPDTWHNLKLKFQGRVISVLIDQQGVANLTNDVYSAGMVGLGSGWHGAQFDNLAIEVEPADDNIAWRQTIRASSTWDDDTRADKANDGDAYTTRWSAAAGRSAGEWLAVDFEALRTFNTVVLRPFEDRIRACQIQVWNDDRWQDAFIGRLSGSAPQTFKFPTVQARQVRLLVTEAQGQPAIWEFAVFNE